MEEKTVNKKKKVIRIILFLLLIVGIAGIGIYPAHDQDITLKFKTNGESQKITMTPSDLVYSSELTFDTDIESADQINEIYVYRKFDSICIDKFTGNTITDNIMIEGGRLTINDFLIDKLTEYSKSFFYERMIYALVAFAVFLLLWVANNALDEKFNAEDKSNHGPIYEIKKFTKELVKYREYMNFAAKADLKAEVANSYLNRLWWLLEPFFNMLVYVIVFGKIMGNSIQNYATFVFSALLMWNFFNKTVNYSVKLVRNNRDIVTKIYVPKHVLLISNMILNFYKLIFSLIVLVPMLFIFKVHFGFATLWIVVPYLLMIVFSFGAGMILLHYGVYVDDLGYAIGIVLNMLMFLSGVFYDVTTGLTAPLNAVMMCLNPVALFMDTMRTALLYNTVSNVPLITIWMVISLIISYIGLHIVYKNENGYVKVI